MTWEHVHLITHAFAIVPAIAGTLIGMGGWAASAADRTGAGDLLERYGLVSLLVAGLFAVPSYLTGIAAADVLSQRTFVQPSIVQTHRTWATWAAVGLATSGILAGFALAQPADRRLRRFVLLTGLVASLLVGFAAYLGGRIVHGPGAGS